MKYYLFLDESGDHGLSRIDSSFPVFVLCGVLVSHDAYLQLGNRVISLKQQFWPGKKVILHSSDIRKHENEFQILFDQRIKAEFIRGINEIMSSSDYTLIASAVDKRRYLAKYGEMAINIYELSLGFILERTIFCLNSKNDSDDTLQIIIEKRGRKEDANLLAHFHRLRDKGTPYLPPQRFQTYAPTIRFYKKSDDKIGLQIADLAAYPISRYIIDPQRANPAFDLIRPRFYAEGENMYGLKIVP